MMNHFDFIRSVCEVVEEIDFPFHAIYYIEDGYGYVETDLKDDFDENIAFSCDSIEQFHELIKELA